MKQTRALMPKLKLLGECAQSGTGIKACRLPSRCTAVFDSGNKIYELEADLEGDATKLARKRGWLTRKFKHAGRRSAPDRWFARDGCIFWVEFKRWPAEPTQLQFDEISEMRAAGLDVIWLDSIEDFEAVLIAREGPQ